MSKTAKAGDAATAKKQKAAKFLPVGDSAGQYEVGKVEEELRVPQQMEQPPLEN